MIFGVYHSPTENAGLIAEIIREKNIRFREVRLYDGDGLPRDTSDLEGLVIMGGPMNVDDVDNYPFLMPELQLIENVLRDGKPILGICLGSQLIAKALGSRVYPNKVREVGWHPIQLTSEAQSDPLFNKFPSMLNVLHWHGDTFDLPEGAVRLASSVDCENQAFRWGENTYGLQFHLEATPAMVKLWTKSKQDAAYVKSAGESVKTILKETPAAFNQLKPHAEAFISSYLTAITSRLLPVR
jgi:GMP synthase (glutamine-hydrolysing)